MASEAKLRGNKKHLETLDDIKIRVQKGERDIINAHVAKKAKRLHDDKLSVNSLVVKFLYEDMEVEAKISGMSFMEYRNNLVKDKLIDYTQECSVFIIGKEKEKDQLIFFRYERSQLISDEDLNNEAFINFQDMKKKRLQNVDELVEVSIVRNKEQHKQILQK